MIDMIDIFEKTKDLISETINLNKELRCYKDHDKDFLSDMQFAMEYCTVNFNIGRQCRKTEFILNNNTKNDLIIVRTIAVNNAYKAVNCDVMTINQILNISDVNDKVNKYETIYFDDSSYMKITNFAEIYNKLVNKDISQTFVHLG